MEVQTGPEKVQSEQRGLILKIAEYVKTRSEPDQTDLV